MRIVIIGGGAVGAATALFLKRQGGNAAEVHVVEPDPGLSRASSALSAGSIRQQFSNAINVRMSQFGQQVMADAQNWLGVDDEAVDLGYVGSGYLFLATAAGVPVLQANHAVQRSLNAPVALLQADELARRFPWLRCDDLALASLGLAGEGWFDGYAFARALARKAVALGAITQKTRVIGFDRQGERLVAAQLADGRRLEADAFVNAAGPWARDVAQLAGITLPVFARRRTVFNFSCPTPLISADGQTRTPLVIDTSGVWFRSEGPHFIGAWTPSHGDEDPDDLPLDQPDLAQFEAHVWPALAERVPAFEALRVRHAWAGYYEVHPLDHNAIIGPHPSLSNLVFANGFSGHGLQHAPAAGRGVAEWLLNGRYESLDLSPFGWQRVLEHRPFVEQAVI